MTVRAMQVLLAEWRMIERHFPAATPEWTEVTLAVRLSLSEIRLVEKWLQEHELGGIKWLQEHDLDGATADAATTQVLGAPLVPSDDK